jgi:uncharacterized membrane protein YraQ (UPF0718 family)
MRKTLFGLILAILTLALSRGGWARLLLGLKIAAGMALQVLPLLVVALAMAGLIQALISHEQVSRLLGQGSGLKGLLLGALAGALVPGGPYVYFPLAATFFLAGAEMGTIVAFVSAKNLWTLSRLPMEMALLDPKITLIRYLVTLVFPPLLGLLADFLFSGRTAAIRKDVQEIQRSTKTE